MHRADKTINTKVGLALPLSEQVRQRQWPLNEGKMLVNTKEVYGSKFGNETHFLSFAAINLFRISPDKSQPIATKYFAYLESACKFRIGNR